MQITFSFVHCGYYYCCCYCLVFHITVVSSKLSHALSSNTPFVSPTEVVRVMACCVLFNGSTKLGNTVTHLWQSDISFEIFWPLNVCSVVKIECGWSPSLLHCTNCPQVKDAFLALVPALLSGSLLSACDQHRLSSLASSLNDSSAKRIQFVMVEVFLMSDNACHYCSIFPLSPSKLNLPVCTFCLTGPFLVHVESLWFSHLIYSCGSLNIMS